MAEDVPSVVAVVDSANRPAGAGVPLTRQAEVHSITEFGFVPPLVEVMNKSPDASKIIATTPETGSVVGMAHSAVSFPVHPGWVPSGSGIAAYVPFDTGTLMIVPL